MHHVYLGPSNRYGLLALVTKHLCLSLGKVGAMAVSGTVFGAMLGLGVQFYSNAVRKLPLMRNPWEHAIAASVGGVAGTTSLASPPPPPCPGSGLLLVIQPHSTSPLGATAEAEGYGASQATGSSASRSARSWRWRSFSNSGRRPTKLTSWDRVDTWGNARTAATQCHERSGSTRSLPGSLRQACSVQGH